ncbi:hypothetical protein Hanom_Chr06g00522391 [Helianthus anomalus]
MYTTRGDLGSYVARKMDKLGNRFGFVSFKDARDKAKLERSLLKVKMGSNKLLSNIARFVVENTEYLAQMD